MNIRDRAGIEKHKEGIEESLGFKFRMSNGFFIYKNNYFKTLWRMLAHGLEDTENIDIVDTLSVVNRPLACVAKIMERERENKIEKYPEYSWFKEVRNAGLYEKTKKEEGRLVATAPFKIKNVDISLGDVIIPVKSSTGTTCGAIIFQDGIGIKTLLPEDDLFPLGYTDPKAPIKFVSSITAKTYSAKKKISYVDTKMLPMIKNGIIVGILKRFVSSPGNEIVFARLIAMNPALIKVKTFTINGHTPAQLLTKNFKSLPSRLTKDILVSIIEFYGGTGRALPKCWQEVTISENITVVASPAQISMIRIAIDTIFESEFGFDLVLRDTGTDTLYRYTSANKKKDIDSILLAMRMYPSIKDILRRIPVLAQRSGVEKILDVKVAVTPQPEGHVYKTGNNRVWIDYDAGILGGTLNKPFSSSLSRLLSPTFSNKRSLLRKRYNRLGKLLKSDDLIKQCILTFVAIEVCIVMSIPFKVRFSRGTHYTRNSIISALSSPAYMPIPISMLDPLKVKVSGSSIAYGEEVDVEDCPYSVVFDNYKPDIVLSTLTPSASDRSITNAVKGVTVVSQHAYMISEVFREIASRYDSSDDARINMTCIDDVLDVCSGVFSPLFEEI